jgi:uncharacterized membrane protein
MKSAARSTGKGIVKKNPWTALDWLAFLALLIWSGAGLFFTLHHVTPTVTATWHIAAWLRQFINGCLEYGDVTLIILAFINTHLHAARQWASGAARAWCVIILLGAYGIECFGTMTTFPFGEYHYTGKFGPMIWMVPMTIPLAWHIVLTNAVFLVRIVLPHATQLVEALLAGILCTAYDFVLEPFATTQKHYWTWAGGAVPALNYIAWFVLSALLIRYFAPTLSTPYRLDPRPWLILGLTVAIFVVAEIK